MPRFATAVPTRGRAPSHVPPDVQFAPGYYLARKLGWFSVALGAAELLAPDLMKRATGLHDERLLAAYGIREILCGLGILTSKRPAGWMWARVAGDAMDLATLGSAYCNGTKEDAQAALLSAVAVTGVTVADVLAASQLTTAAVLES